MQFVASLDIYPSHKRESGVPDPHACEGSITLLDEVSHPTNVPFAEETPEIIYTIPSLYCVGYMQKLVQQEQEQLNGVRDSAGERTRDRARVEDEALPDDIDELERAVPN